MFWFESSIYGAAGGSIVSFAVILNDVLEWQAECKRCARAGNRSTKFRFFTDFAADVLALVVRLTAGAIIGYIVRDEVTGGIPVIAAGASALAILSQFGKNSLYVPGLEWRDSRNSSEKESPRHRRQPMEDLRQEQADLQVNYEPRHAKEETSPSVGPPTVPRQRVQPSTDEFLDAETER